MNSKSGFDLNTNDTQVKEDSEWANDNVNQQNNGGKKVLPRNKLVKRIILFSILGLFAVLIVVLPSVMFTDRRLSKFISVQNIKKIEIVDTGYYHHRTGNDTSRRYNPF